MEAFRDVQGSLLLGTHKSRKKLNYKLINRQKQTQAERCVLENQLNDQW